MKCELTECFQCLIEVGDLKQPRRERAVVLDRHVARHKTQIVDSLFLGRRTDETPRWVGRNDRFRIFEDAFGEPGPL